MRVRPLTMAALGVAAVGLDLRVVAWDGLPDALGWALVAVAAGRLSMRVPMVLLLVAAAASTAEAQLPYRYDALDPISGEVVRDVRPGQSFVQRLAFEPVSGPRLALLAIATLAGAAGLVLLLRELARRATKSGDATATARLGQLSWAVALGWAAPYLGGAAVQAAVGDDGFDPVWNGAGEVPAMVGIVVMVAVALTFATTANRRWSASGEELGSPWAELMLRDEPSPDRY